ncbi:uncharacterized protein LOC121235480 [Juglans microcarpa x Juglans regia]|uniref:uncharacterized protein LOC121235480 n=1 Tax=Juglans microcarpa x Juglans regia TaxID=2249226 RepID=UPI001B7E140B|nr:uncharacterized protein LOC121235480 [Juglans microcarpa x Juglans regia]
MRKEDQSNRVHQSEDRVDWHGGRHTGPRRGASPRRRGKRDETRRSPPAENKQLGEINMITRGGTGGPTITFEARDEEGILHPHDDTLVVTMQVANFKTRRILVDNGSSVDILFWEAFMKMRISPDRLRLAPMQLKGFTGDVVQPMGAINLSILAGKAPRAVAIMSDFLVVKAPSSYNAYWGAPP